MKKKLIFCLLIYFFVGSCTSRVRNQNAISKGTEISGIVIGIIDGDTFDVLINENKTIRIRMEGIDAPERGMPFYRVSKNHLSQLCFNKKVKIKITSKDGHNRYIAYTYLDDGRELSHEMIRAGLAWHFKKYNSETSLAELEVEARSLKLGLWVIENPMAPWTNRSLRWQGISTKDSFNISESQR